jgi:hypothetical protein
MTKANVKNAANNAELITRAGTRGTGKNSRRKRYYEENRERINQKRKERRRAQREAKQRAE